MDPTRPRSILITGASSGIGAALAREYAAPGTVLHLGGRDEGRLAAIAEACRALGAEVHVRAGDVTDADAMERWIGDAFAVSPVDLVIANAGISGGTGGGAREGESATPSESRAQVENIFAVNVGGVLNTILPALARMRDAGPAGPGPRGQIAVMSSLAGFRGLPGAPAYAASKAAVRSFGEGMRGVAARDGIRVSVICPGFVVSPMTDINPYPMPFIMPADRTARIIRQGLARDRARIAFPLRLYALIWLASALPPGLTDPMFARMPEKPSRPAPPKST